MLNQQFVMLISDLFEPVEAPLGIGIVTLCTASLFQCNAHLTFNYQLF